MKWNIGDYVEVLMDFNKRDGYAPVGYRGYLTRCEEENKYGNESFHVSGYPNGRYAVDRMTEEMAMNYWFSMITPVDSNPIVAYPSNENGFEI